MLIIKKLWEIECTSEGNYLKLITIAKHLGSIYPLGKNEELKLNIIC